MQVINKTDEQAEAFAATLADEGDAGVFRNLWARGEHDLIRGHFPAFVADELVADAPNTLTYHAEDVRLPEVEPVSNK